MIKSLLNEAEVRRIKQSQAAGFGDIITSDAVDMLGYESALFVVTLGAVTSTGTATAKIQQSSDNASSDAYADLEDSGLASVGDASTEKKLLIEVLNPKERYLKCLVARATANVEIDSIDVWLFGPKADPVVQGSTVDGTNQVVNPDEGTA